MKIFLNWNNRSPSAEGTRIFRSQEPFDATNLPEVLATVDAGETSYVDETAVTGERYYYRTQVFKGLNTALSSQLEAWALQRTGPGPQQLLDGDLEAGFYGEVASTDFIDAATLKSRFSVPGNLLGGGGSWFKFAHKGKILFTPIAPIAYDVSWLELYNLGLVYGTDDFGDQDRGLQVNQKQVITINGENFLVRLFEGRPKPLRPWGQYGTNGSYPVINIDALNMEGCEWNDLMYRVVIGTPPFALRKPTFIGATRQTNTVVANYPTITKDFDSNNNILLRSHPQNTIGAVHSVGYNVKSHNMYVGFSYTYSHAWRPVLEWIP